MKQRVRRLAPWALLALILCVISFAFANSNTVPTSNAGDGSGDVSGYTVSSIHYVLDLADPSKIGSVTFRLTPGAGATAAKTAKIQLTPSTAWFDCSTTDGGDNWSCAVNAAVSALSVTNLRVVAAQ